MCREDNLETLTRCYDFCLLQIGTCRALHSWIRGLSCRRDYASFWAYFIVVLTFLSVLTACPFYMSYLGITHLSCIVLFRIFTYSYIPETKSVVILHYSLRFAEGLTPFRSRFSECRMTREIAGRSFAHCIQKE